MLSHHRLAEQLCSIRSPFRGKDLVVLVQLDLVVFDCFCQRGWICQDVTISDVVQLLEAIDCNRKNLSGRLENRAVLPLKYGVLIAQFLFFLSKRWINIDLALVVRLRIVLRLVQRPLVILLVDKGLIDLWELRHFCTAGWHLVQLKFRIL